MEHNLIMKAGQRSVLLLNAPYHIYTRQVCRGRAGQLQPTPQLLRLGCADLLVAVAKAFNFLVLKVSLAAELLAGDLEVFRSSFN
jgi:hypothetical protein